MFDDEYHGMGGSYIVDPETGKRKPAPTQDAEPNAEAVAEKDPNATKERAVKKPKGGE